MSSDEHDIPSRDAFELRLLAAACQDDRSPDVQRAWQRFVTAASGIAAAAEPTSGVHKLPPSDVIIEPAGSSAVASSATSPDAAISPDEALNPIADAGLRSTAVTRWAAARWLAIGAVGGGSLTASLFVVAELGDNHPTTWDSGEGTPMVAPLEQQPREPVTATAPALDDAERRPERRPSAENAQDEREVTTRRPDLAGAGRTDGEAPPDGAVAQHGRATPSNEPSSAAARQPGRASKHSIAAQVRALDGARAACRRGEFERCIAVVERFRRDFPTSALLPDAEVLAIEALAALGRTRAAERRATEFLHRRPNDPHAERIRALQRRTTNR